MARKILTFDFYRNDKEFNELKKFVNFYKKLIQSDELTGHCLSYSNPPYVPDYHTQAFADLLMILDSYAFMRDTEIETEKLVNGES